MKKLLTTLSILLIATASYAQTTPTEGIHKKYDDEGNLIKETNYVDSLIEGIEKKYNKKGILVRETTYVNGIKEGVAKKYYSQGGALFSEVNYINGKKEGLEKVYNMDGEISSETNYKNGEKHGLFVRYRDLSDGGIDWEEMYKFGKRDGISRGGFKDGIPRTFSEFKDDIPINYKQYYFSDNVLCYEAIYQDGEITEEIDYDFQGNIIQMSPEEKKLSPIFRCAIRESQTGPRLYYPEDKVAVLGEGEDRLEFDDVHISFTPPEGWFKEANFDLGTGPGGIVPLYYTQQEGRRIPGITVSHTPSAGYVSLIEYTRANTVEIKNNTSLEVISVDTIELANRQSSKIEIKVAEKNSRVLIYQFLISNNFIILSMSSREQDHEENFAILKKLAESVTVKEKDIDNDTVVKDYRQGAAYQQFMRSLERENNLGNDALAQSTLRAMSTASETYATANNGNFPLSIKDLTEAKPAYLSMEYCDSTVSGFSYSCEMTESGYTFVATPTADGGFAAYTIVTGGFMSP